MTFSFHPEALAEYREAALWYERQKPGLGGRFVSEVEASVAAILANPTRFGPVEQGVRRYALKRFPYCLRFVHDQARQHIVFAAVMHVRRHPDYWKNRLPK